MTGNSNDDDDQSPEGFCIVEQGSFPAKTTRVESAAASQGEQPTTESGFGTVLVINVTGNLYPADAPVCHVVKHFSQMRCQVCQTTLATVGADGLPHLIVLATQQPGHLLSPQSQAVLVSLNIAIVPTVLLTEKPFPEAIAAALQTLGIIHHWCQPIDDMAALLKQLEIYLQLGQRTQLLLAQKQRLTALLQQRDQELKQHYAIELALHQKQQTLEHMALIDGLTQIANRRYLDLTLEQEWQRSRRESQPLSFILADVDDFKHYNDTYGHLQGDYCLKKIAAALADAIRRPGDFVGRYGGEEFAVILPNTHLKGAQQVGQSIQQKIQILHLAHQTSTVKPYVTLSMGIVTVVPDHTVSIAQLITWADEALYMAKQMGRNRTVIHPSMISEL